MDSEKPKTLNTSTLMPATIDGHCLATFRRRVNAGSLLTVSWFDVIRLLVIQPLLMRTKPVSPIPEERFSEPVMYMSSSGVSLYTGRFWR
ncbi:hypothetical protein HID58_006053 [Brassica napus]|uniref:Uncharacterized protein n=1 Tax=Brassica napus TaxID=3708 RepID=A0ABQ8EAB4_BRANA|nr:hypothetical protein HID58_006053 [Brassica napus]